MSIQDGFNRTKGPRVLIDVVFLFLSVGFWLGVLTGEYLMHHYNLKKGKREPYREGEQKVWHLL